MFKKELKKAIKMFDKEYDNEFATLQDFITFLLNNKIIELDIEMLKEFDNE